jgi:hypothetical protein
VCGWADDAAVDAGVEGQQLDVERERVVHPLLLSFARE